MNPAVGQKVNGWTLLDRDTFERVIVAPMRASILALPDTFDPGIATNTYQFGRFWFNREAEQFGIDIGDTHDFPGLYTGGRATFALPFDITPSVEITGYIDMESGSMPIYGLNLAKVKPQMLARLASEKSAFLFDGEQGNGPRERIMVVYQRYKDTVVALANKPYYSPSGWVSVRGGIIFVATSLFAAYNAAAAVEAAGAGASGAAQGFGQVVSNFGSMTGDKNLGVIAKVGGAISGQIGDTATPGISALDSAPTAETVTMGFFDDNFDGFNFSSGESSVAFTDSQNVDYGWGINTDYPDSFVIPNEDAFGSDVYDFGAGTGGDYNFNETPEVQTNVFGTVFDTSFGKDEVMSAAQGVQIATQVKNAASRPATTGNKASSGSNGAKQQTGVGDIVSGFGSFLQSAANTAKTISGVAAQVQTVQPKTYTGQLGPGGAVPGGKAFSPVLLIGGLAALGVFIYIARKR